MTSSDSSATPSGPDASAAATAAPASRKKTKTPPTVTVNHLTYGAVTGLANDRSIFVHLLNGRTVWEMDLVERMFEWVRAGSVVIDAGANIGLHTMLFARWAGPKGRVYAFEPQPVIQQVLQKNADDNDLHGITVVPACLVGPGGPESIDFPDVDYDRVSNPGGVGLSNLDHCASTVRVPATTLDQFVETHREEFGDRPISFIKIDVEGAEEDLLNGAEHTLATYHPTVMIEIAGGCVPDEDHPEIAAAIERVRSTFLRHGYKTFERIDDHNYLCLMERTTPRQKVSCILNESHERKVYSQNGEDGIIGTLFEYLGTTNRTFVELGCEDGTECNTRLLSEQGWSGVRFDGQNDVPERSITKRFLTIENVVESLREAGIPEEFDFLSIDVDGNDFYLWSAIARHFRPRVVCVEFNASLPPDSALVIPYQADFTWDGTDYFGASLGAMRHLAARFQYHIAYVESRGVNAFFIHDKALKGQGRLGLADARSMYRLPKYGPRSMVGLPGGHPIDAKHRPYVSYEEAWRRVEAVLAGPVDDDLAEDFDEETADQVQSESK